MKETMIAYRLLEHGKPLAATEIPIPIPGDLEVLAKTLVTGVCHTDVHVAREDWGELSLPITLGHEGVGIVVATGTKVMRFKIGDRIGLPWLGRSCMSCCFCSAGKENLCQMQKQTGYTANGTFAEYFIAHEKFAAKIPNNITDTEAAPILCAGVTAYRALRRTNTRKGDRVVIVGAAGGLGHLAIQYAKTLGLQVIAVDRLDTTKSQMLYSLGADYVVDCTNKNSSALATDVLNSVGDKEISAAIIFAPVVSAVTDAVHYVSPGGTIVSVALPSENVEIDIVKFTLKELTLTSSIVGTPTDLEEAFQHASGGKVRARTEEKQFNTVNEILNDLRAGRILGRVVLRVANP